MIFAVGAVSGTILSFELGLLWPEFMRFAGGIIGMPFSAEGFAFFIEAIFLGMYLYGWNRLSPRAHWLTGIPVAVSGLLSGIFVVSANAWMNSPAGFEIVDGEVVDIDPVAAMFNDAWFQQALHMSLAAYEATAFAVAGVYAWGMLRGRNDAYHRSALKIALAVGGVIALLQPISGDLSARWVAENQPVKFAALEGQFETERNAGLSDRRHPRSGGARDPVRARDSGPAQLPGPRRFRRRGARAERVAACRSTGPAHRPPRLPDRWSGSVSRLIGLSAWFWLVVWRRRGVRHEPLAPARARHRGDRPDSSRSRPAGP